MPANLKYLTVGDMNADGAPDFVTVHKTTVVVWLGQGDLSFTQAGSHPVSDGGNFLRSALASDLDDDGALDVVVTNPVSNDLSVLLGNGDGTLAAEQSYMPDAQVPPQAVAAADLDGDGNQDLVASYAGSASVSVLRGLGDGTFAPAAHYHSGQAQSFDVAVGDFDGDGADDVVKPEWYSSRYVIMHGNGDGSLVAPLLFDHGATEPQASTLADLDGDGHLDLAVADGMNGVSVTLGLGAGAFDPPALYVPGANHKDIAVADFDGDELPDLAVADDATNQVHLRAGAGGGAFTAGPAFVAGNRPVSIIVADLNDDDADDVAVANKAGHDVSVLLGDGPGSLAPAVHYGVGTQPLQLAVGDLDGIQGADLVTANAGSGDLSVLLGNGNGTFLAASAVGSLGAVRSVILADLDQDGALDAVVARSNDFALVLIGNGDGSFQSPSELDAVGTRVLAADVDGDGQIDLVVGNQILLGNGDGTFVLGTRHSIGSTIPLHAGDLDGNGRVDLLATGYGVGFVYLNGCLDSRASFGPDKSSLSWHPVCGAQSYNVYRGTLAGLTDRDEDGLPDSGYGQCLTALDGDPSDTWFLDGETPPAGTGWSYLVSFVDLDGERGLGTTSQGQDRLVGLPCP